MKTLVYSIVLVSVLTVARAETEAAVQQDLTHLEQLSTPDHVDHAIQKGVDWLVTQQDPSTGAFKGPLPNTYTALSCMALMAAGHVPGQSDYGENLRRGIGFLVRSSRERNGFLRDGRGKSWMYTHGICSLALSEAYGMMPTDSENRLIKEALEKANRVTFDAQVTDKTKKNHYGGWRYKPSSVDADLSVTVWLVLALRSAQNAQLHVPVDVIDRAGDYVNQTWNEENSSYGYTPSRIWTMSMRSAGVVCMLALGEEKEEDYRLRHERSMEALLDFDFEEKKRNYYYQSYYVATAANMFGESHRNEVLPKMERALLKLQRGDGSFEKHSGYDGGVYSTAFAILTLSVRYQYLPIYQE